MVFNPDDRKYKSCCGCMHSKRGTFFLGLFNLMHLFLFVCLLAAIPAIRSIKQYFENEEIIEGDTPESHTFFKNLSDKWLMIILFVLILFKTVVVLSVFLALRIQHKLLLVPAIAQEIILTLVVVALFVWSAIFIITGKWDNNFQEARVFFPVLFFTIFLICWFIYVFIQLHTYACCYAYYKDMKEDSVGTGTRHGEDKPLTGSSNPSAPAHADAAEERDMYPPLPPKY